jgi:DNA-binding response OmpR family regulator
MIKILVVDDEEIARITLAEILTLEGYHIDSVESGEEAVASLRRKKYDLMVLDLKMPGIDGMQVLKEVVDEQPNLVVVVLTAYGTLDTAIQAIRYRVHDYILKPADPEQLIKSIQSALVKKGKDESLMKELGKPVSKRVENLPGGAVLHWDKRQIVWKTGSLSLTPTETKLMKTLFARSNQMVSHSELVYLIQGYRIDTEEAAKILRPVVSRLRQKLSRVPGWGDRIKNVRGAGYVVEIH